MLFRVVEGGGELLPFVKGEMKIVSSGREMLSFSVKMCFGIERASLWQIMSLKFHIALAPKNVTLLLLLPLSPTANSESWQQRSSSLFPFCI